MKYDKDFTNDEMRLWLVEGAEFTKWGFPVLKPCYSTPTNAVAWNDRNKEKNPRDKAIHFYVDDYRYSGLWQNPTKYFEALSFFRSVITPDYTLDSDMPFAMQLWQVYRSRAIGYWLQSEGLEVIPSVTWTDDKSSYAWCFDGLPTESVVAVSTNGCLSKRARPSYRDGMKAMVELLAPNKIIVVGKEIPLDFDTGAEMIYFKSHGQLMSEIMKNRRKEPC